MVIAAAAITVVTGHMTHSITTAVLIAQATAPIPLDKLDLAPSAHLSTNTQV